MSPARNGYTLIEMAVVLVILAIAGAVAVPAFAALRPQRALDGAAARVVDALRMARERAVTGGRTTELVIDSANARAWLEPRDVPFTLDLPDGCRLTGGARIATRFAPDGTASGDSPGFACGTAHATASVDPLTGRVRVVESP